MRGQTNQIRKLPVQAVLVVGLATATFAGKPIPDGMAPLTYCTEYMALPAERPVHWVPGRRSGLRRGSRVRLALLVPGQPEILSNDERFKAVVSTTL